jgi:hypothetical protein
LDDFKSVLVPEAVGVLGQGVTGPVALEVGGPCYQWTRKVKGKTVSVALSREQSLWLKEAIGNWRQLQATLKEMQRLSRQVLFETLANPQRRKRLGKKVLGLIKRHSEPTPNP